MADRTDQQSGAGRAVLLYNLYRLGLLAVCLGIGWLAGLPFLVLIVVSSVVAGVLSWFVLRGPREAAARAVEITVSRGQARMAARASAEDGYVDSVIAAQEPAAATPAESTSPSATSGDQPAP